MNQKFAAGLLTLFYVSTLFAGDLKSVEISGFKVLASTQSMMKLQFREEKPFVISKTKFSSEELAKSFCEENSSSLDTNGFRKALLLAMSGAANLNDEIEQAIVFKINDQNSGVAAWTGRNAQVMIMWDGRSANTEIATVDEIDREAKKLGTQRAAAFSAICE